MHGKLGIISTIMSTNAIQDLILSVARGRDLAFEQATQAFQIIMNAGATQKVPKSARESSSTPKLEAVFVHRAILPSKTSRMWPTRIAVAAWMNSWDRVRVKAKKPRARFPRVKRDGIK